MMTQTLTAASKPVALDYDNTLVVAIELSNVSWVLAAQVPGLPRLKAKRSVEPTAEALMAAINGYRNRAREAGRMVERVIAVYEASGSGFWLARWLERGGIYALANIRGGSEYGEGWHEDGRRANKQHGFDDFHAAARALLSSHWTDTAQLGILGGSNGGLLMGAALTQHPGDYRAVVSFVGIYDMLRSQLWPNGEYNTSEYGTVQNAAEFAWLRGYSPLLRVQPATAYPAVLLITGENDPRVAPWHSRKFAAALQKANTSANPILLLTRRNEGHGVTSSFSQRVGNTAVMLSFFAQQLGLGPAPAATPAAR